MASGVARRSSQARLAIPVVGSGVDVADVGANADFRTPPALSSSAPSHTSEEPLRPRPRLEAPQATGVGDQPSLSGQARLGCGVLRDTCRACICVQSARAQVQTRSLWRWRERESVRCSRVRAHSAIILFFPRLLTSLTASPQTHSCDAFPHVHPRPFGQCFLSARWPGWASLRARHDASGQVKPGGQAR